MVGILLGVLQRYEDEDYYSWGPPVSKEWPFSVERDEKCFQRLLNSNNSCEKNLACM